MNDLLLLNKPTLIISNKYEIYNFLYQFLIAKYDKSIIDNYTYFENKNNKYINVKRSKIHIEYTPYLSAIDKTIILEYIYPFCSLLNSFYYDKEYKKIIIIYNFYLLNVNQQLLIYYIMEKFKNFCDFILVSNSIDNIIIPILNLIQIQNVSINEDFLENKWLTIFKYHNIEKYDDSWKRIIVNIFDSLNKKNENLDFIYENRKYISLLFVTNINVTKIFVYLHKLFVDKYQNEISKLCYITELFSKYEFLIIKSTRYIIHFESLLIQIYKFIHYENNSISISISLD